ncbi:STAS-like domain-containing protein [Algoriphagus sp. H41]|uniref:STAS-like domain-containing protein n=1 Tax=Algoriphagus oliviformis TaxID=2811231 RepID=A0ABS3C313_9BACT|nr:STAS-like domain-containing protein [Algoriphagus oliviformis]MBN7811504.1 STAS-like domain-containing protein [Algoriphagus oliviformis]
MENITINIVNSIGDVFAVEAEDGQKVFELISKALRDHKNVVVSFQNVEMLTTAFLNTAIGQLYKDFNESDIKRHLKASDMSDSGKVALKRVVDTAKLYYKDPEAMQRSIDNILGD